MKSMHISVEKSLKKLRSSYIDILYVHWVRVTTSDISLQVTFCDLQWDYTTSIEEVMNGLHALVMAGKVLYLGISDTPAWIVASANQYARMSNRTPFSVYQGAWSVLERDFERDIIPMARAEGMALMCWNVLTSGRIRSDAQERERLENGEKGRAPQTGSQRWERTEEKRVARALEEVAKAVGAKTIQDGMCLLPNHSPTNLAFAFLFSCYRVCDAEDALCVPDGWRTQSRTPLCEHLRARRHAHDGPYPENRGGSTVQQGRPVQSIRKYSSTFLCWGVLTRWRTYSGRR